MSVSSLIEQIMNHPNTTFTPNSASELEILSESTLQQILLGLTTASSDVSTLNTAQPSELQALLDDLNACQEDLQVAAKEETRILASLRDFGVNRASVLSYNTNNAASLNDTVIQKYIQTGNTPLTSMLREGIAARGELRQKAVREILSSTPGVYTPQDLEKMDSVSLNKLSVALAKNRASQQNTLPDFSAISVADNYMHVPNMPFNPNDGQVATDTINPPRLW